MEVLAIKPVRMALCCGAHHQATQLTSSLVDATAPAEATSPEQPHPDTGPGQFQCSSLVGAWYGRGEQAAASLAPPPPVIHPAI